MVRQYQRRSNHQYSPYSKILEALREFRKGDKSLRSVAKDFSIHPSTLSYHNKKNQDIDLDDENVEMERISHQVLSENIEQELVSYLLHSAESYIGLNPTEVRKLAYELAIANNVKVPSSWSDKLIAGPDWFTLFIKRHSVLSIRVPEATSLARVVSFNKIIVKSNKTPLKKIENNVLKKVSVSENQKIEDSKKLINKRQSLKRKLNNETKQNLKEAKTNEDNIINKENINIQEKLGQKHILKIVKSEKETLQEPSSSSTLKRIIINNNLIEEKIKIVKNVSSGAINNKRERKLSTKLSGYVLD